MKTLTVGDIVQSKHKISTEFVPLVGKIIAASKDVGFVAVEWVDGRITKEALSYLDEHSKIEEDFNKVADKIALANQAIIDATLIAREHGSSIEEFLAAKIDLTEFVGFQNNLVAAGLVPDYDNGWQSSQKCW